MDQLIRLRDILLLVLYTLTAVFALFNNGLVFIVTFRRRHYVLSQSTVKFPLNTTRIFLFNLALADTLLSLTMLIQFLSCSKYSLENLPLSSYICISNKFIQILAYNASTFTICLIAYDRYRLIQNPLLKYYRRKLFRILLFTWILSILLSASYLISTRIQIYFVSTKHVIGCQILLPTIAKHFLNDYILRTRIFCVVMLFYIMPLFIISILCTLTIRILSRRTIIGVQRFRAFEQTRTRSSMLLLITVIIFVLSRTPIHFIHLRELFISSSSSSKIAPTRSVQIDKCNDTTMYLLFYWLSLSSCCHNPIIYSWFNRRYRTLFFYCCRSMFYWRRY
ncbi:hypothetical protein I4U23_030020 [Adineta vaga]|nr:hypothetical protein I4U23_030020 [Adineta vaga]